MSVGNAPNPTRRNRPKGPIFIVDSKMAQYQKTIRNMEQQTQQLQGIQSQLQSLQHNSLRIAQQMPRQIHPQMQPIQQPQQQQLDRIRRRQPSTPRPVMDLRAQQIAAISNLHAQTGTQFRQMTLLQIPQVQTQSMGIVRAPPVKVEGFQELMGGDATSKHDADENRLMSPQSNCVLELGFRHRAHIISVGWGLGVYCPSYLVVNTEHHLGWWCTGVFRHTSVARNKTEHYFTERDAWLDPPCLSRQPS
ncbi:hypothetical protein CFP56_038293 [Quercus suber]|uniref:Uncharacterized protein n=1 Tax=Quercus suber TaxID=58331 RepID=A0AAW0LMI4_QUESU